MCSRISRGAPGIVANEFENFDLPVGDLGATRVIEQGWLSRIPIQSFI